MKKGPTPIPAATRFEAKWCLDSATGCHTWTATTVSSGYGCFYVHDRKRQILAHRFAYESARGAIPKGMHIDHLCRNKKCVNPAHLEAVAPQENHRRVGWKARTHCQRGHEMSPDNVYVRPSGGRRCRACERQSSKAWASAKYAPRMPLNPNSLPPTAGLLSLAFL